MANLRHAPRLDKAATGVGFIDLLFALVVVELFKPLYPWWTVSAVGWVQISLAALLTLCSWIGYHVSVNRPRWVVRFPNIPLAQYLLDIAMLGVYYTSAEYAIDAAHHPQTVTYLPQAAVVFASFFLYFLWDLTGKRLVKSPFYITAADEAVKKGEMSAEDASIFHPTARQSARSNRRVAVTRRILVATVVAAVIGGVIDSLRLGYHPLALVVFDSGLALLVAFYRVWKDFPMRRIWSVVIQGRANECGP